MEKRHSLMSIKYEDLKANYGNLLEIDKKTGRGNTQFKI